MPLGRHTDSPRARGRAAEVVELAKQRVMCATTAVARTMLVPTLRIWQRSSLCAQGLCPRESGQAQRRWGGDDVQQRVEPAQRAGQGHESGADEGTPADGVGVHVRVAGPPVVFFGAGSCRRARHSYPAVGTRGRTPLGRGRRTDASLADNKTRKTAGEAADNVVANVVRLHVVLVSISTQSPSSSEFAPAPSTQQWSRNNLCSVVGPRPALRRQNRRQSWRRSGA